MKAKVFVRLKKDVLDPQGKAIQGALESLGYKDIQSVRQGKIIEIELGNSSREEVQEQVKEMCEKLLANTVIEDYEIEIL